jgi:hypothetical protein
MRLLVRLAVLAAVLSAPLASMAQDKRTVPVRFAPGATAATLRGSIVGDQSISYTFGAEAGQTLELTFRSPSRFAYFNLYAPGRGPGDEALAIGDQLPDPTRFAGQLPGSGTYTVSVFLNRAAARRGQRASFTLAIAIPGATSIPSGPVRGDFADGLQGGPDTWVVAGVPPGDGLHLRRGPSFREPSLAVRPNGTVLRNGGCRMVGAQRWCQVETTSGEPVRGWVNGRYLREGPGAAVPAASRDLAADCRRFAAVDFATRPDRIRILGTRPGPEGSLVDATADLGVQGVKPFACRFDPAGLYLGVMSKVNEGTL